MKPIKATVVQVLRNRKFLIHPTSVVTLHINAEPTLFRYGSPVIVVKGEIVALGTFKEGTIEYTKFRCIHPERKDSFCPNCPILENKTEIEFF